MRNLRLYQIRDEGDGWYGVVFHTKRGTVVASPVVYPNEREAIMWADYYEKIHDTTPVSTDSWIIVGKS